MPSRACAAIASLRDPDQPSGRQLHCPDDVAARFQLAERCLVVVPLAHGAPAAGAVGVLNLDGHRYAVHPAPADETVPPAPLEILTSRELEIATLVAAGLVNKQIARRLGISMWTVAAHLNHAFIKLGVHTRAEMAARVAAALHYR